MIDDIKIDDLRRIPRIGYYFRYPLHRDDFHDLCIGGNLEGHFSAKPLYGDTHADGRVNRSAGFNGDIVSLFIPVHATAVEESKIVLTHTDPDRVTLPSGQRNWPVIRAVAEHSIRGSIFHLE